jgi:hypothetical protein
MLYVHHIVTTRHLLRREGYVHHIAMKGHCLSHYDDGIFAPHCDDEAMFMTLIENHVELCR